MNTISQQTTKTTTVVFTAHGGYGDSD